MDVLYKMQHFLWEAIKPGTERNGTGSNDAQYGRGRRIRDVLMSAHHGAESSSCVLYQPRRRDKHPADSIEPHQAY